MKNIYLIAFFIFMLFVVGNNNCFGEENKSSKETTDKWTKELTYGGKIQAPFCSGVFYQNFKSEKNSAETWGAVLSTDKVFPDWNLSIKVGKLSGAGGLSKLNSPLLSTSASAFSTASTGISGITVSLPGSSSFTKPFSFFGQFAFNKKNPLLKGGYVNIFFVPSLNAIQTDEADEDSNDFSKSFLAFSFFDKIELPKKINYFISTTAGVFQSDEKNTSQWYYSRATEKYHPIDACFCWNLQQSIIFSIFSSCFAVSAYENHQGKVDFCFRNENKLHLKRITLSLCEFYNPFYLSSSSEKTIPEIFQVKSGIQYTFFIINPFKEDPIPVFIKTGFFSYYDYRPEDDNNLKMSAGFRLSYNNYAGSLLAAMNQITNKSKNQDELIISSIQCQIKNSWHFNYISPSVTATYIFTPNTISKNTKTSEKITATVNFGNNPNFGLNTSFSLNQKDKINESKSFSTSLSGKYKQKYFSLYAKIGIKWEQKEN
ncbi:MAG: hypothetical protein MJ188_05225 [Treponema sp.]|nr:hypothetical protein [Treponema sp.]